MTDKQIKELKKIILLFLMCFIVRNIEVLILRIDTTIIGVNILHQLFLISIFAGFLLKYRKPIREIGFNKNNFLKYTIYGISIGIVIALVSYSIKAIILMVGDNFLSIEVFVQKINLEGMNEKSNSIGIIILCMFTNIVMVVGEEGFFRGMLINMGTRCFSKKTSNLIQSFLFALWSVTLILQGLLDNKIGVKTVIIIMVLYVILNGFLAYQLGSYVGLTGVIWIGVIQRIFNYTILSAVHILSVDIFSYAEILIFMMINLLVQCILLYFTRVIYEKRLK